MDRVKRALRPLIAALVASLAVSSAAEADGGATGGFQQGTASGDVTSTSAIIWARGENRGRLSVEFSTVKSLRKARVVRSSRRLTEATDFAGQVQLRDLEPETTYFYRAQIRPLNGRETLLSATGSFTTAPDPADSTPVSLIWGGDLGGQSYCRRVGRGYDIFAQMEALKPDFFLADGDMIYADNACPAAGPDGPGGWENVPGDFASIRDPAVDWTNRETVRENFRAHWRYNRADEHQQRFLRSTSQYTGWDDHEVINDFGGPWDFWIPSQRERPGYPNLVEEGRQAFFDWNPIRRNRADPERIYRDFQWGEDVELILLDQRSYRSRNDLPDTPANDKTLLGKRQLGWLKEQLRDSQATWKLVNSHVPFTIPTGSNTPLPQSPAGAPDINGRDAWANGTAPDFSAETGFEREMLDLLRFIDEEDIDNVVFLSGDVHFPQSVRVRTDLDGDGDALEFHELVSGPLSAVRDSPRELDPTLEPVSLYAEAPLFNFGYVQVREQADGQVHLIADVRGEDGSVRPGSRLDLEPK